ncbi:MAG: dihydroorotase [Acidobacteria bacterium]|nr:dihydroorotase [Acidobacteriota bacterium]
MSAFDLILAGGEVLTPAGLVSANVGVRNGRVAALGDLAGAEAPEILDVIGLTVMPGVIDTQVHFREPGLEHKEDLESGSRAAALGGVTAFFEMPNTKPATTTRQALEDKLRRAAGRAWVDHAFFVGATASNISRLGMLEMLPGCAGVKLFMGSSTGDLLVHETAAVAGVLGNGFRRVSVHSEDEERLRERRGLVEGGAPVTMHPEWRDAEAAIMNTRRLLELAADARRRVHVLHVTTLEEMQLLADAREFATVEVTPQHLTLSAPECYEALGSRAQMNPPVREERHRLALWRALEQGLVDVLGSDHAPHTLEEKKQAYPASPSGMTGVQTLLPIMLDHVNDGLLSLERLADLTSAGPARIFNIAGKGRIAIGYDADFAVVDRKAEWTITDKWIASKSAWTPYQGRLVKGKPIHTLVRGNVVVRDGAIEGRPLGEPVRFLETLVSRDELPGLGLRYDL